MKNDFNRVIGHRFNLRADWGAGECQVMAVETNKTLSYARLAYSVESVVIGTLIPTGAGAQLRMEQAGFRADQHQAYKNAKGGWQKFVLGLVGVVGGLR